MKKVRIAIVFALLMCLLLTACGGAETAASVLNIDFSDVDYASSEYKHLNNGGVMDDDTLPYNVDVITGATLTVEGPGVVTSIPLSIRELENRNDGLFRGLYTDKSGQYIYEGMDVYYMLSEMTDGDNGIFLTDGAYRVQFKNSNRATVAEIEIQDIVAAHDSGEPVLIAYGIGSTDGSDWAPFVFDAKGEGEHSLGFKDNLGNDDGCLKLVFNTEKVKSSVAYETFSNVAYVYVCEEAEPGFKHTTALNAAYSDARYTDYVITFRGAALGREIDLTVAELEALVENDENGFPVQGGLGYRDSYSLANNAYWYVNSYEGLDLYKLLCYLGMDTAEEMGRGASRTTVITFNAADGRQSSESFSVEALSYPDAFGFYNKNATDQNDGTYVSTNADLVKTGYPVLLAYGVNNYPYTASNVDAGYLSGLANNGGPMRVVFGKTQYNHANGSNQVQYLSEIIVGDDCLYNTHGYSEDAALAALADSVLNVDVMNAKGESLIRRQMTVGEIEELIYGADVPGNVKAEAKDKAVYTVQGERAVYEGIDLEYYLMNAIAIPGTVGTATFSNGSESVTLSLNEIFAEGYNADGLSGLGAMLAFAKNGSPLVEDEKADGYTGSVALDTVPGAPESYTVDNEGGPLMLVVPATDSASDDGVILKNVTSITVDLLPDAYAHLEGDAAKLAQDTVTFTGEGLAQEKVFTVSDLESRQVQAKTLDYSILNSKGTLSEQRYRGVPVYTLFAELGIRNNAGDVTVTAADGSSVTISLSKLKGQNFINYANPEKRTVCAMLAYGTGEVDGDILVGTPLDSEAGGPLKLIIPMGAEDEANASLCVKDVKEISVSANEVTTWGHSMSDVYSEFLEYPMTLTVRNDEHEYSREFTAAELEAMEEFVVRDEYSVLEIGTCEGIDLWKFAKSVAGDVPGMGEPISVTVYADDGYKNDILSVVYMDGLENGVTDASGNRKSVIICYAVNGLPCVDSESHEGYTGIAGNMGGPLRIIVENVQGASVKYFNKLVITVPGTDDIQF